MQGISFTLKCMEISFVGHEPSNCHDTARDLFNFFILFYTLEIFSECKEFFVIHNARS